MLGHWFLEIWGISHTRIGDAFWSATLEKGLGPVDAPRLAVKFRQFQKIVGTLGEHSNKPLQTPGADELGS